jgi:hypothetical protein
MAYTALQLITRSYYLAQLVSRDLQTPTGDQISDGLYLLNAILDFKGTDLRLIPYFTNFTLPTVQGQELYVIPNLLLIDTITFNIGPVRYSMNEMTRYEYFGTPRVDNIQSLPYGYRYERQLDGGNLYLYFLPQDVYQVKIWGKFALTEVGLQTDLSTLYDFYYIEYLRYELANYLCGEYGDTFPEASQKKLDEIRKKLMDVSPKDLAIRKRSYFTGSPSFGWQEVNLFKGWWPG